MSTPSKTLNTGSKIPVLGFATRNLSGENCLVAIQAALDSGCRHFDSASFHLNEVDIGDAMQKIFDGGKVERADLFLTSEYSPASLQGVRSTVQKTLTDLKTEYLDLYLLHDPNAQKTQTLLQKSEKLGKPTFDFLEIWKEMEALQQEGLVRNIGLSDFKEYHIEKLLKNSSTVPSLQQVNASSLEESHLDFCKDNGIVVAAYTPLRQRATTTKSLIMDRSILKEIASSHGKTTTQISIRSQIQRGLISVVESIKPAQIKSKFQVFDFELDNSEMTTIMAVGRRRRRSSIDGHDTRLIDIIDEKQTMNHPRSIHRIYSNPSNA